MIHQISEEEARHTANIKRRCKRTTHTTTTICGTCGKHFGNDNHSDEYTDIHHIITVAIECTIIKNF